MRRWGGLLLLGALLLQPGPTSGASQESDDESVEAPAVARAARQESRAKPPDHVDATDRNAPAPGMRGAPAREQFLQHALGTQGDVRVPAVLLSLAALLAVVAVAWRRASTRQRGEEDADDDLPEIEGRDDLGPDVAP